jgi:hypothetical protein
VLNWLRKPELIDLSGVPRDGVIIAATGRHIALFAEAVPQGHVYVFEPRSYARAIAAKLKNVSLFPMKLADTAGSSGCPVFKKVTFTTLDLFAEKHGLKRIDFIKGEKSVMDGAEVSIARFRPVVHLS